jgi:endoglucanase
MSERPGKRQTFADSMRTNLIGAANRFVDSTSRHGYGRPYGSAAYYWGSHGALTASTYALNAAYELTSDVRYRNAGHELLGHILGRNYFARSFITGVGRNPPQFPHDRRSSASKNAWPGYLVGGPNNQSLTDGVAPPGSTCATAAVCYFDYEPDYARNEIAINWNASMIYALAGFVSPTSPVSASNRATVRPAAPKTKITRMVQVKNGRSSMVIPPGAKIYSLDGRLVAQRKTGDANAPVLRRNGVFIMKLDVK